MEETKRCEDCKQEFPVNASGWLVVPLPEHHPTCTHCGKPYIFGPEIDGQIGFHCPSGHSLGSGPAWYGFSSKYCPYCREERRKKNRQAYPLCPMCKTPTRVWNFLRDYREYQLDTIKICCESCIPRFEALSETEQLELLRRAMVQTYGETAVIYALQYDDTFPYHHIGRTKHFKKRMAEYKRNWYREVKVSHVLEEIPFGALAMERETRWILHALKHGWPIDNFDMFTVERHGASAEQEEHHARELQLKEELIAAVADFEPLTAPFETVEPLFTRFSNTWDTRIVNWFVNLSNK